MGGKKKRGHRSQSSTAAAAPVAESLFSFEELDGPRSDAFFLNTNTTNNYGTNTTAAANDDADDESDADAAGLAPDLAGATPAAQLFARIPALSSKQQPQPQQQQQQHELLDIFADVPVAPLPQAAPTANQDLIDIFGSGPAPVVSPNEVTLDITHDKGALKLTVGDLMAKLERLDKLQSMFNDLEKTYKKQSKHNMRINEILISQSSIRGGVPVGDDGALEKFNSFLLDQRIKIEQHSAATETLRQEVSILKEQERLIKVDSEAKNETIRSLQTVVHRQEEEIKYLKKSTPPSRADSPVRRSESFDTSQKYRSGQSPVPSPSTMKVNHTPSTPTTPTATTTTTSSSFFNFLPMKSKDKDKDKDKDVASSPTQPQTSELPPAPSPSSDAASTFQMKLKIRDLANALKKVTDQRDLAIVRIKELQHQAQIVPPSTTSNQHLSLPMGTPRLTSVDEPVAVDLDARRNSGDSLSGLLGTVGNELVDISVDSSPGTANNIQEQYRTRIKELEALTTDLQKRVDEQVEANKKLRTSGSFSSNGIAVRKRVSSGHFFEASSSIISNNSLTSNSNGNVNDAEVSGVESELLEKKEEITSLQSQIREIGKSRDEEVEKVFVLETRVAELEALKKAVEEKLDSVDRRYAASLDSMAAVHEITIKTMESDLENRKRLMGIEVERANALASEVSDLKSAKDALDRQVVKLEGEVKSLHSANETAVSSLVESEMARKKALENAEQLQVKLTAVEEEVKVVSEKLAAMTASHEASLEKIQMHSGSVNAMQEKMEAAQTAQKETVAKMDKAFAIIRKLKTEAETKDALKIKLEEDLAATKNSLEQAEQSLQSLRADVEALKSNPSETKEAETGISQSALDLELTSNQISTLAADIDDLKKKNASLQSAAERPGCDHGDVASLYTQISKLETDCSLSVQEVEKLHGIVSTLNEELAAANQRYQDASAQSIRVSELEIELAKSQQSATNSSDRISSLEAELVASQESLATANKNSDSRISQLEQELTAATSAAQDLKLRVVALETELKAGGEASASNISASDNHVSKLQDRVSCLEEELASSIATAEELRSQIVALEASTNSANTNVAGAASDEVESLKAQLTKLEREQTASADVVAEESEALRSRLSQLEGELAASVSSAKDSDLLRARASALEEELAAAIVASEAARIRVSTLEEELAAAVTAVGDSNALRARVSILEAELAAAVATALDSDPLRARVSALEGELAAAVAAAKDSNSLRARVSTLETELAASAASVGDSSALRARVVSLETELADALKAAADAASAVAAAVGVGFSEPLSATKSVCTHTNVEVLEETITQLRSQLSAVIPADPMSTKELETLKNDLIDAKSRMSALESLKKELETQLEASNSAQKETVAKMDKAYAVVRKMRTDADNRIKEMDAMKVQFESEAAASKAALKACEEEIQELKFAAGSAKSELASLKGKVAELSSLNDALKAKLLLLENDASDPLSTCTHEDVDTLRETISQLRLQLAERSAISKDVAFSEGSLLESIRLELAESRTKLTTIENAKAVLEAQLLSKSSESLQIASESGPDRLSSTINTLELKLAQVTAQLHAAEESLALEKQSIHTHVENLHVKDSELMQTKAKLAEEEEKKNKSIQLLRNMKAKILKLEDMVQSRDAELSGLKEELKELRSNANTGTAERDAKLIALAKQVEDMSSRIRKQNDDLFQMEKLHELKNVEIDEHASKMKELRGSYEKTITERNQLRESDTQKGDELEALKVTLSLQSAQLTEWNERVKDLEFRISNLDAELETSKRLFESKSIEYETLQIKLSDVEKQFYETEQAVGSNSDEVDHLRREIMQLRRETSNLSKESREKDTSISALKQDNEVSEALRVKTERMCDALTLDLERLKAKISEYSSKEEEWKSTVHQIELLQSGRELEINAKTQELHTKLNEQAKIMEESKTRENQLLKLNKSLKDEVRKLARSIGIATPTLTSPTLSHHNSGLDEREIAAANAQLGMGHFSVSRKSSLGSGLDLSGSSNGLNWTNTIGSLPKPSFSQSRNNSIPSPTTPMGSQPSQARLAANEEYLKNVVLRFVESKRDTKLQMVPALGMLLRLTPEEVKRVQKCI